MRVLGFVVAGGGGEEEGGGVGGRVVFLSLNT